MINSTMLYLYLQTMFLSFAIALSVTNEDFATSVPPVLSPFGSYPNVLGLTPNDRQHFHPIVKFPRKCWDNNNTFICPFSDYSKHQPYTSSQLLGDDAFSLPPPWWKPLVSAVRRCWRTRTPPRHHHRRRYIGRYDEDRVGLYASDLFVGDNRTVHVGIDLVGPPGTPVYSFADGRVYTAGYNSPRGDYGHVVVVEYNTTHQEGSYYVLYGHLDAASSRRNLRKGKMAAVRRGEILGWMGDASENGGWTSSHVHVQVSTLPPRTHDMPGAVRYQDRSRALLIYPDPRYIVGPLH